MKIDIFIKNDMDTIFMKMMTPPKIIKNVKNPPVIEVIRATMLEGGSFLGFLRGFCVGEG